MSLVCHSLEILYYLRHPLSIPPQLEVTTTTISFKMKTKSNQNVVVTLVKTPHHSPKAYISLALFFMFFYALVIRNLYLGHNNLLQTIQLIRFVGQSSENCMNSGFKRHLPGIKGLDTSLTLSEIPTFSSSKHGSHS